jgi:hypothetical protein
MDMNTPLCVRQNCGNRPQETQPRRIGTPGQFCTACYHDLKANLIELSEIYHDCESALRPRRNPTRQRVSGGRQATGILLDEEAITTRSRILSFLASWSALVADERAVTKPIRRPAELTAFLIKHLNWLLAHPAAADFAEETIQTATYARHSVGTPSALRIELGPCIHPDCGTSMTTMPGRDGQRTREVRCTAGHTWQPHQWLQLFRQIQQTRHAGSATERPRLEGAA